MDTPEAAQVEPVAAETPAGATPDESDVHRLRRALDFERSEHKASRAKFSDMVRALEEKRTAETQELEMLRQQVHDFRVSEARRAGLDSALRELGPDFTIPDVPALAAACERLAFDPETFKQAVLDLVNLVKRPAVKPPAGMAGPFSGPPSASNLSGETPAPRKDLLSPLPFR